MNPEELDCSRNYITSLFGLRHMSNFDDFKVEDNNSINVVKPTTMDYLNVVGDLADTNKFVDLLRKK